MAIAFIDLAKQQAVIKEDLDRRIQRVLAHGQYIMGPEIAELEQRLANYVGTSHCITVGSGTDALLISLMALGVGPGDEVITPAFTFVATAEVIALLGATPVFVDVDPSTCNIDASKITDKITEKTKGIIPVNLYGQPADYEEIAAVAGAYDLFVVEDAAQSFGALYKGKKSCGLTTMGCTSFFPSKPLGCYGDGGAIFTEDDQLAAAAREIRIHGQSERYFHTRVGLGGRMDTLQAAVVLAKLEVFDDELRRRQTVADRYASTLAACEPVKDGALRLLTQHSDRTSVHAQFTVAAEQRTRLQDALKAAEIPTAIHYPTPLNQQPAYSEFCCPECTPVAAEMSNTVLSLPMGPYLSSEDQHKVLDTILATLGLRA